MKRFDDHKTGYLFDPWGYLGGKRRRLLEQGWPGVFRKFLLEELPVEQIASHFDEGMGRPTKELFAMAGTLVLQQMLDLSDEDVSRAYSFDACWHYALGLRGERDDDRYVCSRTLRAYRRIAIEHGVDGLLFVRLTDCLVRAFKVDTSKQRLDSTHIRSNMRDLRRAEIFGKTKPDLITHVDVEPACQSDADSLLPAIEVTQERDCGPTELLADGGYGGDENVQKAAEKKVEVAAPANKGMSASEERLSLDDFQFDEETGEISRCPAGEKPMKTGRTPKGNYTATFDRETCCGCELRDRCPVKVGVQTAALKPYDGKKRRLAERRAKERTEEFREKYRWRAGVEATMSRYKSQTGAGRLRVRRMPAVRFAAKLKALGLNIFRCSRATVDAAKAFFSAFSNRYGQIVTVFGADDCLSRLAAARATQIRLQPFPLPSAAR